MKRNNFILIIFTISSLMLFGCDQIIDRSLEKLSKTKNNESILTNKESSLKSLGDSNKENSIKKLEEKKKINEGLSKDNSKELKKRKEGLSRDNSKEFKKRYDVIGTNKDGPYRSGETSRIRSTK